MSGNRNAHTILLLIVSVLLLAVPGACRHSNEIEYCVLAGVVEDTSGLPLADVLIAVGDRHTKSDSRGEFMFADLLPGDFLLTCSKDDYKTFEQQLRLFAGSTAKMGITLHRDPVVTSVRISPAEPDFGTDKTEITLTITPELRRSTEWQINIGDCEWLELSPAGGIWQPGESTEIACSVDRTKLPADDITLIAVLSADTFSATIPFHCSASVSPPSPPTTPNNPTTPNTPGSPAPAAHFTFAGTLADSQNHATATAHGNISYNADGTALSFAAGSTSYITITPALIDCNEWSIAFNIQCSGSGNILWVETEPHADNLAGTSQSLSLDGGDALKYIMSRTENWYNYSKSTYKFTHPPINDGRPHTIVITSAISSPEQATVTTQLYVDGAFASVIYEQHSEISDPHIGKGLALHIGGERQINRTRTLPCATFTLSNLRLYPNHTLTPTEASTLTPN